MDHGDAAQLAALVGAAGASLALLTTRRAAVVAGFVVVGIAEALLAWSLVPARDLELLTSSAPHALAAAAGVVAVLGLAAAFVRAPALVPVALLVAAPFRIPVDLGEQRAFLLLPLYGVLAAASLALIVGALRGRALTPVPRPLAVAASGLVAVVAVSLLWSSNLRAGSIELGFFLFPFAALLAVVARAPWRTWHPRALIATLTGVACVLAAIGLWQAATHRLFFAPDLEVANAYTSFFRVTSLFKDPSLYGRHLVVAIVVLLAVTLLRRLHAVLATALIAFLWLGLYFSYSQSSLVTLFAAAAAVAFVAGDRRMRLVVASACAACMAVGAVVVVDTVRGESLQRSTSGRSELVSATVEVFENHPVTGVGVGSQPLASTREARPNTSVRRNTSHTTPLTIAAEQGLLGLLAYAAFLVGVAAVLLTAWRSSRTLGLALGGVMLTLLVHSLFYSGFFQDPLTWGVPAVAAAAVAARAADPVARAARAEPSERVEVAVPAPSSGR